MSKLTDTVAKLAAPVIEKQGCTLWDVEYVKEAGTWYLPVSYTHLPGTANIRALKKRISRPQTTF